MEQRRSKVKIFHDSEVPARSNRMPGMSLVPWRRWLNEGDFVYEPHAESVYPVDEKINWNH